MQINVEETNYALHSTVHSPVAAEQTDIRTEEDPNGDEKKSIVQVRKIPHGILGTVWHAQYKILALHFKASLTVIECVVGVFSFFFHWFFLPLPIKSNILIG